MSNWRYYQETGAVGGTTALQYVDSFNGDDANSGAYNAPKQSIQGAFDVGVSGMTIVCSGYFNEGDFVVPKNPVLMPEGLVTFDGTGFDNFPRCTPNNGNYGTSLFKDYFAKVNESFFTKIENCIFQNVIVGNLAAYNQSGVRNCLFINSEIIFYNAVSFLDNCTFINSKALRGFGGGGDLCRNNYFDSTSVFDAITRNPPYMNHNFFEGTMVNKIRVGNVWYDNVEALQAATAYESDSLPSTTDPLINSDGYSISETSPLRNTGWDKRGIGYTQMAHNTDATAVGVWTLSDLVLDTDKFILDVGATTGTATSSLVEVFSRVRTILSINLPDFVINPYTGETIGRLASDRTPYSTSVEVQYSTNGTTTNGTWLRVPIGTKPLHDTVNNVGNDDPLFDIANAVVIEASHLQYRITLRNNETPLT